MKQEIQVYIGNHLVDISKTASIRIKKQLKDIKEYSKKKTSFSKPINVLFTKNNALLFGSAFNINTVNGWDKNSRPVSRISVNGEIYLEGLARLEAINYNSYSFTVYAENINLTALLGDDLIKGNSNPAKDISFVNQYEFNFTRPNLRVLMQNEPRKDGKGINYCYADLTGDSGTNFTDDRLMIPSIAARELLEHIMLGVGKTITLSPVIEKYLNAMYLPFNGEHKKLTNVWDYAKYTISDSVLADPFGWIPNMFVGLVCVDDKIRDIATETTSFRPRVRVSNNVGKYKVKFTCKIRKLTEAGSGTANPVVKPYLTITNTDTVGSDYLLTDVKLNNITTGANNNDGITLDGIGWKTGIFEAEFEIQGGNVFICIRLDKVDLPNGEGKVSCADDGTTFIEVQKLDSYYNEDTPNVITADKILPLKYRQIDFFNDIVTLFNARVLVSGNNIHLQTTNEYSKGYSSTFADWTKNIDERKIKLSTLLVKSEELQSFSFLESDDLYSVDYLEQFKTKNKDKIRESETKKIINSKLNFAATHKVNSFMSMLNADGEYSTKLKPRILFVDSISTQPLEWGLDKEGVRDRNIAHLHIFTDRFNKNLSSDDNMSIAFSDDYTYSSVADEQKTTSGNIFNRFYSNDETLTTSDDLMFLKSDFYLNSKQLSEINFKDIIYINTQKHGSGYYRVNEATYTAGSSKPALIELIQTDLGVINSIDYVANETTLTKVNLTAESETKRLELSKKGIII